MAHSEAKAASGDWSQSIISIKALNWNNGLEHDDAYQAMVKFQTSGGMHFVADGIQGPYVLRIQIDSGTCALKISSHEHPEQSRTIAFDPAMIGLLSEQYELQQEYTGINHGQEFDADGGQRNEDKISPIRAKSLLNKEAGCKLIKQAFAANGVTIETNGEQPLYRLMTEVLWKQRQRGPVQRDIRDITYKGFHSEKYLGTHDEYVDRLKDTSRVQIASFNRPYAVTVINNTDSIVLQFNGSFVGKKGQSIEQCRVALPKEYWLNILGKRLDLVGHHQSLMGLTNPGTPAQIEEADAIRHEHHNATAALLRHCLKHESIDAPQGTRENDVCRNIVGIVTELLEGEIKIDPRDKPLVQHFGDPNAAIPLPQTFTTIQKIPKEPAEGEEVEEGTKPELVEKEVQIPVINPIYNITGPVTVSAYASPTCTVYQFIGSKGDFRITMPQDFNDMLYANAPSADYTRLMNDVLNQAGITADQAIIDSLYALADRARVKAVPDKKIQVGAAAERIITGSTARYCA